MKIAVNTRLLIKNKLDGIGWFTFETLKRITKSHPEHQFFFLFDRNFHPDYIFSTNVTPVILPPETRHPFLYYYWFEHVIPKTLKKLDIDLFFSPDGYLSIRSEIKSLTVIHDLNFEHSPEYLPFLYRKYYRHFFPIFAQKAKRIATVSEFSKKDIAATYQVSKDKIDVVYNGANPKYQPLDKTGIKEIRLKYTRGAPYFIFVGSMHPRKNIDTLFRAFDLFKTNSNNDIKLVMVGEKKWWSGNIKLAFNSMRHKDDVVFTDRLNMENLSKVMAAALALTYVSHFEGFGIPLVEAMNCDVPIITSNVTSMPEIAGNAAIYVDSNSITSIESAMIKITEDELLRTNLIENGRKRRLDFSWDITAQKLWTSIEKVLTSED